MKISSFVFVCAVGLMLCAGCGAPGTAPTLTAVAPTLAEPTAGALTEGAPVPVIGTRADRRAPTQAPTATPTEIPTATPLPTSTETPLATATAFASPTRTRPSATATPRLAPAVYVTRLAIDPPAPKSKPAQFLFRVNFLNTVGETVNYSRWRVLIFPKGETRAIGDPRGASQTIAAGASEQMTEAWSIRVPSVCEPFTAQAVWEDENGKPTAFPMPDGKNAAIEFQVCP